MVAAGGVVGEGRYRLLERLGTGGMAEVWLAADQRLNDRQVAVKVLHTYRVTGPEGPAGLERARREAFAASRLSHPNVVGVLDFLVEDGEPLIVMEYVAGSTLGDAIPPGGMALPRAVRVLRQVAAALADAHAAGVVHRDVKPANVLLSPRDDVKLADFGIARSADDPRLTGAGTFSGTVPYLAPEVVQGRDATAASDLWSFGALAFEVIEGRRAFDAPTSAALMMAVALGPLPVATRAGSVASTLASLLQRDPAVRPSAADVVARLTELERGPEITAPHLRGPAAAVAPTITPAADAPIGPPTPPSPPLAPPPLAPPPLAPPPHPRHRRRRRLLLGTGALVIVAALVTLFVVILANGGGGSGGPTGSPGRTNARPKGPTVTLDGITVAGATDLTHEPTVTTTPHAAPSEIDSRDLVVGTGAVARSGANVTLQYSGYIFATGTPFISTWKLGHALDFTLATTQLIVGFIQGIAGTGDILPMRVGGRRLFVVPPKLAYGNQSYNTIPPDATLFFVVDLKSAG